MTRSYLIFLSFVFFQFLSLVSGSRYCPNPCYNEVCNSGEDCYYDRYDARCYCQRNGLSGGGIAGIVIAAVVGVCLCVACAMMCNRRRQMQAASYGTSGVTTEYGQPVGAMYAVPAGQQQQGGYGYPQQPMHAIPVSYAQQQPQQGGPPAYNASYNNTTMEGQAQNPQQYYTGNPQATRAI